MSTRDIVAPILHETYGKGAMVVSLVDHLAKRIDAWPSSMNGHPSYGEEKREGMIRMVCWDWMAGGGTAERVATKIETALREVGK